MIGYSNFHQDWRLCLKPRETDGKSGPAILSCLLCAPLAVELRHRRPAVEGEIEANRGPADSSRRSPVDADMEDHIDRDTIVHLWRLVTGEGDNGLRGGCGCWCQVCRRRMQRNRGLAAAGVIRQRRGTG